MDRGGIIMAQTSLPNLDVYDDFEDNAKTGRVAPYKNIVDGTTGTVAITNVSPISGTYSLTHVGGGASGSGNRWLYESSVTGKAGVYNYEYTADFDIKLVSKGANAAEPAAYLWFFEFTDTDYNGGNQRIRLFQKVAGVTTTLATATWLSGAAWAVGATYHMTVRVLDTGFNLYVGTTSVLAYSGAYLGATTYNGGGGGDWTTKIMWDNIVMRGETSFSGDYVFKGSEPVIGAVGSEVSLGDPADPSAGATDDSNQLTFNVYSDFPVVLELENWDGSIRETKPFYWTSTQTYALGYEGLDQYLTLRARVYAECTEKAVFNVKSIAFRSE
jgi:hypothetical protein